MDNHNKIRSFIAGKCPNCGQGNVFKYGPYNRKFVEVNHQCDHCQFKFEPEPGFYFGAMYFTYAINVGLMIITLIIFNLVFEKFSPFNYLVTVVTMVLLFLNVIVRTSRLLMLYLFGQPRS
jgi:uncharacterized protein (DUF983 family)